MADPPHGRQVHGLRRADADNRRSQDRGRAATPAGWFPGADGSRLIVASAAGAAGNPAWYHDLAAHPGEVQIEAEGRKPAVVAEQFQGAARADAWQRIIAAAPRFAKYQQKTDRELPIIRLMPRPGSGPSDA